MPVLKALRFLFEFRFNCGYSAAHFWACVTVGLLIVDVMVWNGAQRTAWFHAISRNWMLIDSVLIAVLLVVAILDAKLPGKIDAGA